MAAKLILSLVACFLFSLVNGQGLQAVNGRIKITVGTTSGCSDTVRFISEDLAEAYALYGEFLDVEFIPWGRTVRNADGSLQCQFGVNDCWANRLHRCVLDMLRGDQAAQMHYMNCEFTTPYPSFIQGSYLCAQAVGLNLVDVDYCVAHPDDDLDFEAERIGSQHTAAINFIPTIVFNDEINLELHTSSLIRLTSMICLALAEDPSTGVTNCSL